jgi:NADPH-dependent 2,4-dienoyl-CoA reductase/sulfur reductase-like enzyme/rhodanese-related sulfurtransferase
MKIVIIGGVAAGTSAAVRARRNSEKAEIVIYDRDTDVAHAGFATHYAVGGQVDNMEELVPKTPEWFKQYYNIDVHTDHEITSIDHENKIVYGKNLKSTQEFESSYDVLVFANGTVFGTPPVFRGRTFDNLFRVKTVQMGRELQKYIDETNPKTAVVIGTGYIGLGVSEQLTKAGLKVRTLDFLKYPMAQLDHDISTHIADILADNGVEFHGNEGVVEISGEDNCLEHVITSEDNDYEADIYILATGVRPNTQLAESIGVELGETRAIKVNNKMETNLPSVYAVGDVAEAYNVITKEPMYLPLATTATKMGRIAGDAITGGDLEFRGILGTSAVKLFGQTIASTGMTELKARDKGLNPIILTNVQPDTLKFMGGQDLLIKAIADSKTEELLGVQIIGPKGAERRIDVFATAMTLGAKVSDLFHLDLAFTPPISTPKDPVMYTGMALTNAINKTPLIKPEELLQMVNDHEDVTIIDIREKKIFEEEHIEGAMNIPLTTLRDRLNELDPEQRTIVYCNSGQMSYNAQQILLNNGFKEVYNLSGGNDNYQIVLKDIQKNGF